MTALRNKITALVSILTASTIAAACTVDGTRPDVSGVDGTSATTNNQAAGGHAVGEKPRAY